MMIKPTLAGFKPVDGDRVTKLSKFFDRDNDGKLSIKEMDQADSTLTMVGKLFGRDDITNMGRAFAHLSSAVANGNSNVDSNGDKMLEIAYRGPWPAGMPDQEEGTDVYPIWDPPATELASVIARNDKNKLEQADLADPRTKFEPVKKELGRTIMQLFDRNNDNKADVKELNQAGSILERIGNLLGNNTLLNLAKAMTRLGEEVEAKNKSVDRNGDGAIGFANAGTFPPGVVGLVAPSEYDTMTARNDASLLEVQDLGRYVPQEPGGPTAYLDVLRAADANGDGVALGEELKDYQSQHRHQTNGNIAAIMIGNYDTMSGFANRHQDVVRDGIREKDLVAMAELGGDAGEISSFEAHGIEDGEREQQAIDNWIEENGLNQYGDPKNTAYAGGNPLFDESGRNAYIDRYDYILRHNEERPWLNPLRED